MTQENDSNYSNESGLSDRVWFGDDARKEFPSQIENALTYVVENKYEYGPKFRDAELDYEVIEIRYMNEGMVRVTLQYTPKEKFRGKPGLEYMDIDEEGNILARRQIRIPKENLPWVLISAAGISVILAVVLIPIILFLDTSSDPLYVGGRTLYFRSGIPEKHEIIYYQGYDNVGDFSDWTIQPKGVGTELVIIDITITNQTSGAVNISIDSEAAELTTNDKISVGPIDPVERSTARDLKVADGLLVEGFVPIWGDIVLEEGMQIRGKMVFEVPAGSDLVQLRWKASDIATIRY